MRSTRVLCAAATVTKTPKLLQAARPSLIQTLEDIFQGPARVRTGKTDLLTQDLKVLRSGSANRNYRNEIVSANLCDDTINYLAPTLEKHKGCIIVDFNPGACLWSSKLHDFLKPKRHVLMEPDARYYEPFIKPLLEQPDSTYRHTSLAGYDSIDLYNNYDQVMKDRDLFPVTPVDPDDPQRQRFDPGVLFVGNLARLSHSTPRRISSLCNLSLIRFTGAMVSNQLIHKNGLARMLFWVPESDKSSLFPYNEGNRSKLSMAMGLASHMTEAVGVTPLAETIQKFINLRGPGLEAAEDRRVQESMQSLQMQAPRDILKNYIHSSKHLGKKGKGRANQTEVDGCVTGSVAESKTGIEGTEDMEVEAASAKKTVKTADTGDGSTMYMPDPKVFASPWDKPLTTKEDFVEYFTHVESRIRDLSPILGLAAVGAPNRLETISQDAEIQRVTEEIEFPQCHWLAEQASARPQSYHNRIRAVARWDTCLRVYKLEIFLQELLDRGLVGTEFFEDMRRKVVELGNQADGLLKKILTTHIGGFTNRFKNTVDHQISFFSKPPGLPRDRRLYEPLKASEQEFWPPGRLMLLDFQPREIDFLVQDLVSQPEQQTIITQLLTQLLNASAIPVGKAMDQIAPNMAEDLIPLCPSMRDPRKGGRFDAANMRVGMLTEDMIRELIVAFVEWPFRPSTVSLMLGSPGAAVSMSDEDTLDLD